MSHEFKPASAYACTVCQLLTSRIAEYIKDHEQRPLCIHVTPSTAELIGQELTAGLPPPPGVDPKTWRPILSGGRFEGVPVHLCNAPDTCSRPDIFIGVDGSEEII